MAGSHFPTATAAATATVTPFTVPPETQAAPIPRRPSVLIYCPSSPFPSKRTRRKNHLRQKILKTLENPLHPNHFRPELPSTTHVNPKEGTTEQQEAEKFSLSETSGLMNGIVPNISAGLVFKISMYFVCGLVFQIAFAIVAIGLSDIELEDEDGNLITDDYYKAKRKKFGVKGKSVSNSFVNGDGKLLETKEGEMVLLDESEMSKRIVKIQEMAREARHRETLDAKKKGLVGGDDDDNGDDYDSTAKSVIEKEVDDRLVNLQKRLEKRYEKLPYNFLGTEGEVSDEVDKGNLAAKQEFGPMMFQKKFKFRSPSINMKDKPKGFGGTQDHKVINEVLINGNVDDNGAPKYDKRDGNRTSCNVIIDDTGPSITDKGEQIRLPDGGLIIGNVDDNEAPRNDKIDGDGTLSDVISDDTGASITDKGEQIGLPNGEVLGNNNMHMQGNNREEIPLEESKAISEPRNKLVNKSAKAKPRVAKAQSNAGTTKEARYDEQPVRAAKCEKSSSTERQKPRGFGKESEQHGNSNSNARVKGRRGGNRKSANKLGDKKSSSKTDFWWLNLPYVMAVLMQRDSEGEGSEGLFTIESTSGTMGDSSYTVAFEDRGDATNFSYLLESYFADLGDFRSEILPIPVNELTEAVKSQIFKVLVVKKGQLQLYAGQPLTDVEMALQSLIEQND